jgi:hypothetical protein
MSESDRETRAGTRIAMATPEELALPPTPHRLGADVESHRLDVTSHQQLHLIVHRNTTQSNVYWYTAIDQFVDLMHRLLPGALD